jgi:hypothetical protein
VDVEQLLPDLSEARPGRGAAASRDAGKGPGNYGVGGRGGEVHRLRTRDKQGDCRGRSRRGSDGVPAEAGARGAGGGIALGGGALPQKSTDFYPKLLSGETIYRIEERVDEKE